MIVSHCPYCGLVFPSRAFKISGSVKNLSLKGNRETCPRCRQMANVMDGVFDITNNVVRILSAPQLTKDMLQRFGALVQEAKEKGIPRDELEKEAAKIDPLFGEARLPREAPLAY